MAYCCLTDLLTQLELLDLCFPVRRRWSQAFALLWHNHPYDCCRRFSHATEKQLSAAELSLETDTDMPCWPLNEYFCNSSPSTDWLGVLKLDKDSPGCTPSSQPVMPSHQQPASADPHAAQEQPKCQEPFAHDIPPECSAPAPTNEIQGVKTL